MSNDKERRDPDAIEQEITSIRNELDELVAVLDRRRHEALDWRLQARRHERELWIAAGVVGATTLGVLLLRRARRSPYAQTRQVLHALRWIAENPENVARVAEESNANSRLTAGAAKFGGSLLAVLARDLIVKRRARPRADAA